MEEVKKSVNPIVYKSASVRNLPVPVQSLLQHRSLVNMESEDPPFENPFEKEYNRVVSELALQKEECETKIEELQQRIKDSWEGASGGERGNETSAGGSGDTILIPEKNASHIPDSGRGNSRLLNLTRIDHPVDVRPANISTPLVDSSGQSSNLTGSSSLGNGTAFHGVGTSNITVPSLNNTTVPTGGGCTPCPTLHEICGPSTPSHGDRCATPSVLATPEAILVGAASAVLILVVAAAVAIIVRYLPNITSGLLIVAIIALVWYLSSMYPEAARRLGARAWEALRRAATSIVDRVLRRHHSEVKNNCMG